MSEVLAAVEGHLGHITLNRPNALNALTLGMVEAVADVLERWRNDDAIRCILLDGAGERAFCAGGDIRAVQAAASAGDYAQAARFFRGEYSLNGMIATYKKPVVAIMDGITMGGGIGLGGHASRRVVTERSVLAMPEARIGFFTDVGATWLFSRAPGELGTHIGLTGARLTGADAIEAGLADSYIPFSMMGALAGCLRAGDAYDSVQDFAVEPPKNVLEESRSWIDRCYQSDDAAAIVAALRAAGQAETADTIESNSPSSVKTILRALRNARDFDTLEACLDQDFRLAMNMIRTPDFREGVRAAVIDKDRSPRWSPPRLADADNAVIARYFDTPPEGELGLTRPGGGFVQR
ncbi:enoyl-CoA hydratase/isomerase family protein [soil metagenome]